ncbi:MAG: Bpu10I family restriction endonuclease [Bacteroidales bacterium]|nr:Bpu10I family restriction endonuclease [Bacteroidales bacterium]
MNINKNDYDFICEVIESYPQLSHASNIITKCRGKRSFDEERALELLIPEYAKYLRRMLDLKSYDENAVCQKVAFLNEYYNYMHTNGLDRAFSSQGKFRPTILEEFLFLLFKDYVSEIKEKEDRDDVLDSGNVKAYSNIYFKAKDFIDFIHSPEIGVNEKDQDYAIYRTFDISINKAEPMQIRIPAIAIEAKTYVDKTMLDSIIATAEKIKSGNPYTRFITVAERYDVSYAVDPAYSRIDQIYVLRKSMRKAEWCDIDQNVVWRMVRETIAHLKRPWSDIAKRIKEEGVII